MLCTRWLTCLPDGQLVIRPSGSLSPGFTHVSARILPIPRWPYGAHTWRRAAGDQGEAVCGLPAVLADDIHDADAVRDPVREGIGDGAGPMAWL